MTIGFWVPGDPETLSGGYEYGRRLAEALKAQGHEVEIVRLDRGVPSQGRWDLVVQDELVHRRIGSSNRNWYRSTGIPVVVLVHHLKGRERRPWLQNLVLLSREKRYLSTAHGYLYNSLDTKSSVEELFAGAANRPNLVQVPGLEKSPLKALLPTGQRPKGAVVLFSLGAVSKHKGQLRVFRALKTFKDLEWRWIIAGPNDVEYQTSKRLNTWIRRYGWESRVTLLGRVDQKTLNQLWTQTDVFVLPAGYEGYGMAVLEASARGIPVVTGNRGGVREIVVPGETGFLTKNSKELKDALKNLLISPWLRESMGKAGRERHRTHPGWAESFRTCGDFLESVLSSVPRP